MLRNFIITHCNAILKHARKHSAKRSACKAVILLEIKEGIPLFLDQLTEALSRTVVGEPINHDRIKKDAAIHGMEMYHRGFTVARVIHNYGDVCQIITGMVYKHNERISAQEFQTLNVCLDDAIVGAVTAYEKRRIQDVVDDNTERLGILAHEMRNVLASAVLAFGSIRRGAIAPGGATAVMLERSHVRMGLLIDRSLAEVRLETELLSPERLLVRDIIEEVGLNGAIIAQTKGISLIVPHVSNTLIVEADRAILAAAVSNLVQNALKFTLPKTTVSINVKSFENRVLIEVEDSCGGLPAGMHDKLLQPFVQSNKDRTGMGLGLYICKKAVKTMSGELRVRDVPGKGCVFTMDLPNQPSIDGEKEWLYDAGHVACN